MVIRVSRAYTLPRDNIIIAISTDTHRTDAQHNGSLFDATVQHLELMDFAVWILGFSKMKIEKKESPNPSVATSDRNEPTKRTQTRKKKCYGDEEKNISKKRFSFLFILFLALVASLALYSIRAAFVQNVCIAFNIDEFGARVVARRAHTLSCIPFCRTFSSSSSFVRIFCR